jgi:hypothetical protein
MKKIKFYLIMALLVLAVSCVRKNNQSEQAAVENENVVEVAEVVQASGYTYLKVKENSDEKWMAVSKQDVQTGDVLYYDEALQMTNFHSKDLDRTFDVIYFVNQVSKTPILKHPAAAMHGMGGMTDNPHSGKIETGKKSSISLEKSNNELTLAQIFENRKQYSGKEIEIRGIVVKVNKEIMGKNWVHIQDGTDSNGKFDLTITTNDMAEVNDEVIFKGKITLNKDFGSGYSYEVIMEDAVLINKATVDLPSN